MGKLLDKLFEDNKKKSLYEQYLDKTPIQGATDIQLGQYGVGDSQYDTDITPGNVSELESIRGQRQSRTAKVANAIPRLISKVGTEVAKTPAYLYAMGEAVATDKTLAETLDNAWLNTLEGLDQKTKQEFAIYKPKSVTEGNLWDNITSTSFWTDEGVDGAGFLIAMLAPGMALRGANIAGNLSKVGVGANTAKNIELGAGALMNSALESAAEAKGLVDQLKPQLMKLVEEGKITQEEANQRLGEAGKNSFLQNMALIAGPNFLMQKNLLGRFIPSKTALSEVTDEAGNLLKPIQLQGKELANQYAKEIGTNLFSEGFIEEGGQFAIENYNKKLALGQTNSDFVKGILESYGEALTSTEGQKSIFLGSFLGGLGSGASNIGKAKKDFEGKSQLYDLMQSNFNGFDKSISDLYTKDKEGNLTSELNPVKVKNFMQDIVKEHLSSQLKDTYATLDNKEAYDYISNQEFTKFALPYLQQEGGLQLLNKHIDQLSKKLIDNEKNQRGVDTTLDEVKYITNLKLKGQKLQKVVNSINSTLKVDIPAETPLQQAKVNEFTNRLKSTAIQETSKQLFLNDRINNLNLELVELEMGLSKDIPQNKIEADKIKNQIEKYNNELKSSIEKYNKIFDKEEQKKAFNISNEVEEQEEKVSEKETKEAIKTDVKQFAERIKNGEVLSTPEDQEFYTNNSKEIEKELQRLKKEDLTKPSESNIDEENINERAIITTEEKESKKALDPFKSENGWDGITFLINGEKYGIKSVDDNKYTLKNIKNNKEVVLTSENLLQFASRDITPSQDRFYTYVRNTENVAGHKFLPVTKKNNPELYEELLKLQDDELDFNNEVARQHDKIDSIYLVLLDSSGNQIKVDNKPLFTYMTRPERIDKSEILSEDKAKLVQLREEILALKKGTNQTLIITDKSKGTPQFEPKVNGERQSNPLIGTLYDNKNEIKLELVTQEAGKDYGFLSNGQIANPGKLYALKGKIAIDLIPRKLNEQEVDKLTELLEKRLKGESNISKEIEKLIFFGIGKKGINNYTVAVKEDKLYLGKDIVLTLDIFNPTLVKAYLLNSGKTVHINNKYGFKDGYIDILGNKHDSYQDYLVLGDNPLFGTDLKPKSEIQFRNQYLIYNPELKSDNLVTSQPEVNTESKEEEIKPFPTEASNLDPRKSEIEKRRQEDISNIIEGSNSDDSWYELKVDHSKRNLVKEKLDGKYWNYNDLVTKINAKYDAELAALEEENKGPYTKNAEIKIRKPRSKEGDFDKKNRLASVVKDKSELTQQEINWFKNNFPNIPLEKVKGLIDEQAFGQFLSSGKVLLSDEAPTGTLYHEAFHTVTQLYLTDKEVNNLYNEAKERTELKDNLDIEELLAEDFAEYKKTGKILKDSPVRNTLFRKLINFIKDLLNLPAKSIQDIYRRLDKGFYKNKKRTNRNQFSKLNKALKDKSEKFTKDLLDGMDAIFFKTLFLNNKTVIDSFQYVDAALNRVHDVITDLYEDVNNDYNYTISEELQDYVYDNWEIISNKWLERMNSLGANLKDFDLTKDYQENIIEEDNLPSKDENESVDSDENIKERSGEAYQEANLTSAKSKMFNSSKFLIRSLVQKDSKNNDVLSELGLSLTVQFDKTYNYLLKELTGLGWNYNNYYNKISELTKVKPEFNQILTRLLAPGQAVTMEQIMLQNQFVQDFNKNKATSYITLIEGDKIYQVDATQQATVDRIKDKWQSNLRYNSKQNVEGRLIFDYSKLKGLGNIKYLEGLGFTFSKETIKELEDNKEFSDAVTAIRNYITSNNGDVTTFFSGKELSGRLSTLAQLEAEFTPDTVELSYINSENKTVYSIGYNNFLSIIKNTINRVSNLTELYQELPHLKSVTTEGSLWLNKMFDKDGNKREGVQINLNLQDGVKNKDNEDAASTRKLSIGDKLIQDINSTLLNGLTNYIRASDKATEHTLNLSGYGKNQKLPVSIDELKDGFDSNTLKEIFRGYFKSEFKRIALFKINNLGKNIDQYQKAGNKWTIFSSILNSENKKFLENEIDELKLQDLDSIQLNNELDLTAQAFSETLDKDVIKFFEGYLFEQNKQLEENRINLTQGISSELKQYNLDQLVRALIVTDMINSIEQTKLFIGDMAFYKDLFKRTSSASGTKESCRVDNELHDWLNNNNKRLDKKLADGKINVSIFNDSTQQSDYIDEYIDSLVSSGINPELAKEQMKAYSEMDEGDAQGWITIDEFREFSIRLGKWDKYKEDIFDKLQNNKELTPGELSYFLPLKAQYFGPQDYKGLYAPAYHKYSLMPLIPQLVKGRNLEVLLKNMTENQIGYALFKTGSKVGTPVNSKGEANNFYTDKNNGEINTSNWTKQVISYKYLGLQQKSSEPKEKVIFGTQFRKLLFSNLYESGLVNEGFTGSKQLFEEYNKIIDDLIKVEKDKLIKELGLNPNNYTSEDVTKLVKLLQQEAKDRALPDNLIESLQSELIDGKYLLKYKFDSMVNKPKIDSMLMAIINSRLIRQKINGDALVQGASSGFEKTGNRKAGSNSSLKFYTNKGENGTTTHAECMVAMNKNYKPLLDKYGSLEALNQAIKDNKVDKRLLQLVGYRIPTQGLNSIDMLEIKEFLPETSGTLIVLPTEIVAKSGGDYDIDKMNIFRPKMDKEGNYIQTPENRIIEIATQILSNPTNFNALITPNSTKILTDLVDEIRWIEHKNSKPKYTGDITQYKKEVKDELNNIKYTEQLKLTTKTKQFQKFMLAKDMIGIAAIQNTHHIISQLVGLTLNKTYYIVDKKKPGQLIEKNRVISFEHNRGNNNTIDLGKTSDVEGKNRISEVISQIINATVDAAKDPFLFDLNMTLETLSTYTYLIRIGVPFDTVVYFMKQPIITKYLTELSVNQSMFLGSSNYVAKEQAKAIVKNEYKTNELIDISKVYNSEELKSYLIKENQQSEEFKANQLHILDKFLEYQDQSSMLSDAIKSTNYDTKGLGKNYGTSILQKDLEDKVFKDNFVNGIDRIKNNTFIGAFDQVDFSLSAYGQFYDIYNNKDLSNTVQNLINKINPFGDENKIKLRTLIENDLIQYITQNYGYNNITELQDKLFKTESVAKELLRIKNNPSNPDEIRIGKNMLIEELYPLINQSKQEKDNIKIYSRRYDTFKANQLTESFNELRQLDPVLAKNIMDVGIIQSGLNNSPITYLGLIPYDYYNELVKQSFLNFNKKNGAEDLYKFQALFLRENPKGIPKQGWIYGKNYDVNSKEDYVVIPETPVEVIKPVIANKYELFPGVFANKDQEIAIDKINNFLNSSDQEFLLAGKGGTGKTSIVNKAISEFKGNIVGATVADEARGILQESMKGKTTKTIASLLGLVPDFRQDSGELYFRVRNSEEEKEFRNNFKRDPIESADLVIIDESSMITNEILDLLLKLKRPTAKLIFMGDNHQLPPIGDINSPIFERLENTDNYSELTIRMRQKEESPILPVTDIYADNIDLLEQGKGVKKPTFTRIEKFDESTNQGVKYIKNNKELITEFVKDLKEGVNSKHVITVVARNETARLVSDAIRNELLDNPSEDYQIGEIIRVNQPYIVDKEIVLANGFKGKIIERENFKLLDKYEGYRLTVEFDSVDSKGNPIKAKKIIETLSQKDLPNFKKILSELGKDIKSRGLDFKSEKRAFATELYPLKEKIVDIGYNYAITSHKVQGSTYEITYVMEDDIMSFPDNTNGLTINRMMYTAISRPKTKLVIYSPSQEFTKEEYKSNPDIQYKKLEVQAIPLREDTKALYKEYNLLTNDGKIKIVPDTEKTKTWVKTLNQSPYYSFRLRNTPGGLRILIYPKQSNQLDLQFNREEGETEISKEVMQTLLDKLKDKLGIDYELTNESGDPYYSNNKVVIPTGNLTLETPLHEFSHGLFDSLEKFNPKLFNKLIKDILATEEGKQIEETVERLYPEDDNTNKQLKEIGVRALTEVAKKNINPKTGKPFLEVIKRLFYALKQMFRSIFGKDIKITDLNENTTLQELADMLTIGTGKIDLILINSREQIEINRTQELEKIVTDIFPNTQVKQILYHGSNENIEIFDKKKRASNFNAPISQLGFSFTPSKRIANLYGKNLHPVILNIQELTEIDIQQDTPERHHKEYVYRSIIEGLEKEGLLGDGVELPYIDGQIEYLVFEPEQIYILTQKELNKINEINTKYNNQLKNLEEIQFKKSNKNEEKQESAFTKQEIYFSNRIKRLTNNLNKLQEGTNKYEELEKELDELKEKFNTAKTLQNRDLFRELGEETLSKVEEFIIELEEGSAKDTAKNIEHSIDVINTFSNFDKLRDDSADLLNRLKPFIDELKVEEVQEFATEKVKPTLEDIENQDTDISKRIEGTGSLSDLANYIGRTIGSLIKSVQNKVETFTKRTKNEIERKVKLLNDYAKKNGASLENTYKLFVQESDNTLKLVQPYFDDGKENPNWNKIQSTPELKQFYDFYVSKMEEAQKDLPIDLGKSFIPNIRKTDLKSKIKSLSIIKERIIKEGFEEENLSDVVPLEYHKNIPASEKSSDLGTSLFEFSKFAYNQKEMSDILPKLRLLQESLTYKIVNGNYIERQFKTSNNPKLTIPGRKTNLYNMIDKVIDMQVKGNMKLEQFQYVKSETTDENGNTVQTVVDGTKAIDLLLKYNSLLRISLSPITSLTNWIFGDISNTIEAIGGQFFNTKQLHQASKIFFKQNFDRDSVMNKLLEELNPLQELMDYSLKSDIEEIGTKKLTTDRIQEIMYSMQTSGEKFLQSRTLLAVMIKESYLTSNGELTDKYKNADKKEKQQLSDKVQRLNQKIHGRYSVKEAATLQQNVLFRLISQFRKWVPAAYEARFNTKQYDNRLQADIEGSYKTFNRLVLKNWKNPKQAFENLLLPLINAKKLLKEGKLTESEVYNMRKMAIELISIGTLTMLYAFLHGGDDDKDKLRRRLPQIKLALTLLDRASGDLTFFYSPEQINQLGKNAIPLSKTIGDIIQATYIIPKVLYTGDYTIKKGSSKGHNRILKEFADITPLAKPAFELYKIGRKDVSLEEQRN